MPEHGKNEDLQNQSFPVYNMEQIDQMILEQDSRSTDLIKKVPNMVKKPIYLLNEKGEKVPLIDEDENIILNEEGAMQYVIKDYVEEQQGWIPVKDVVPASEIFTRDNSTSNLSLEAIKVLLFGFWLHDHYSTKQMLSSKDYSYRLHKIRNDGLAILNSAKSYNNCSVQAVKTFRNVTDTKQWLKQEGDQDKPKTNPFAAMFGGIGKKTKEQQKPLSAFEI